MWVKISTEYPSHVIQVVISGRPSNDWLNTWRLERVNFAPKCDAIRTVAHNPFCAFCIKPLPVLFCTNILYIHFIHQNGGKRQNIFYWLDLTSTHFCFIKRASHLSQLLRLWYFSHRRPAQSRQRQLMKLLYLSHSRPGQSRQPAHEIMVLIT